jgi:hypothetical protein
VSAVDRGAGDGVKILMMKRDGKRPRRHVKSADKPWKRTGKFDKFFGIDKADDDDGVLSRSEYEREVMRADEGDTVADTANEFRGGDQTHLADLVADRLVEMGRFPTRVDALRYITGTRDGMGLLRLFSMHKGVITMSDVTKALADRREALADIVKGCGGILAVCKSIVDDGESAISEHELSSLAMDYAKMNYPALTQEQAYAKLYADSVELRKAIHIAKAASLGAPFVADFHQPPATY